MSIDIWMFTDALVNNLSNLEYAYIYIKKYLLQYYIWIFLLYFI